MAVTIVTSNMTKNFEASPSVVFLDGTYKLNIENYCLYAMVVQDRYGHGKPVGLSFLAAENMENIALVFDAFKGCHKSWDQADYSSRTSGGI